jgi:initiation factor 1A
MGGKHASRPKKSSKKSTGELVFADEALGEHYARCVGTLGGGRVSLQLQSGTEVNGKVKGSLYKRVWVNKGDLVLAVERRIDGTASEEQSAAKFDIVHKFSPEEERLLVRYGELSAGVPGDGDGEGGDVVFCDDVDAI